jgi:hypothetical protein
MGIEKAGRRFRMKYRLWLAVVLAMVLVASCSGDKGAGPEGEPENHVPVLGEVRDTTTVLGDTLRIVLSASDADGDTLEFEVVVTCSWSELQLGHCPETGVKGEPPEFWFWPRSYDATAGVRQFSIIVRDDRGAEASTDFVVTIVGP